MTSTFARGAAGLIAHVCANGSTKAHVLAFADRLHRMQAEMDAIAAGLLPARGEQEHQQDHRETVSA